MILFRTSFSILVIILSVLAVYTQDSNLGLQNHYDSSETAKHFDPNEKLSTKTSSETELKSKAKSLNQFESIGEQRGDGTGGSLFEEFWHSLYVDRTFNSSFALNVPLFTITVPGYGRGLKHQTPLSALNVGMY